MSDDPSDGNSRPRACAVGSFAIENRLARPVQLQAFHPSQKGIPTTLTLQPRSVWSVPGFLYPTAYRVERRHLVEDPHTPGGWVLEEDPAEVPPPGAHSEKKLRKGETSIKVQVPAGIAPGDRVSFTLSRQGRGGRDDDGGGERKFGAKNATFCAIYI
jgi:hypothetical protein